MRTTLTLDDDVLFAAKALAHHEGQSLGKIVSDLARRSLRPPEPVTMRNGISLLPLRPGHSRATLELVNALRDEAP